MAEAASCLEGLPVDLAGGVNGHPSAWLETRLGMEAQGARNTPNGPRRDVPLGAIKATLRLGLKVTGLWPRGLANGLDIRYRTVELSLPRLPRAFDGYRILQISDPHFDAAPSLADAILGAVAGAEVDLCVLTGDYRAAERGPFTETGILEPLAALCRSVRSPDGFRDLDQLKTEPGWASLGSREEFQELLRDIAADQPPRSVPRQQTD